MKDCSSGVAPIMKDDKLHLNQCPRNDHERKQLKDIPCFCYWKFMYAQVCTKLDIAFAMGSWEDIGVIRVWTIGGLQRKSSDFAGCVDSRKSRSGYMFMIANGAVSWRSAEWTLIATSTMEAKFVSCFEVT
ncbi:UNVERIFIED_CONTAM: Retrovirus-related Pol polyprotein from transposon TNT 1-94 [Sesamum latifolium]|uniref:Retrovirus-related Pol polyprotein from transposon TNT 1-94 n=1 Tax=Sesamum latifolium TaxID=2727402 RepID=A0AAW2YBE3_9LAMI